MFIEIAAAWWVGQTNIYHKQDYFWRHFNLIWIVHCQTLKGAVLSLCPDLCVKQSARAIHWNDSTQNSLHCWKEQSFSFQFLAGDWFSVHKALHSSFASKVDELLSERRWLPTHPEIESRPQRRVRHAMYGTFLVACHPVSPRWHTWMKSKRFVVRFLPISSLLLAKAQYCHFKTWISAIVSLTLFFLYHRTLETHRKMAWDQ